MADAEYSTSAVYRERDTGKIRVKGATKIEPTESGDTDAELAAKIDEILALLTAAGINPE